MKELDKAIGYIAGGLMLGLALSVFTGRIVLDTFMQGTYILFLAGCIVINAYRAEGK